MDGRAIPDEAELSAESAATYDARKAAPTAAELASIRAEADHLCRGTIAREQAAGQRAKVPAPPDPPFRPGGIRERALAALQSSRRSHA